jgi:hypothetical protein
MIFCYFATFRLEAYGVGGKKLATYTFAVTNTAISFMPATMKFVGLSIAAVMLGLLFLDGILMLLRPAKWLQLPSYVAFQGSSRRIRRNGDGYLQIRLLGLTYSAFAVWVIRSLAEYRRAESLVGDTNAGVPSLVYTCFCLIPCLASAVYGLLMALRPRWWIETYTVKAGYLHIGPIPLWPIRLLSLVLIVPAIYFGIGIIAATW